MSLNDPPHFKSTQYGFEYGALQVTRVASHNGYVVLGIGLAGKPDYDRIIEVYASPTGKSLRVFRKGKELKP